MSYMEVFPEELLHADKLEATIKFLRLLPAPSQKKVSMIIDWCKEIGVPLTWKIIERVTGGK